MSENQDKIDELLKKLDLLINQQEAFSKEVNSIKAELHAINPKSATAPEEITSAPETAQTILSAEPKVFPNSTSRITWLEQNPIDAIADNKIHIELKSTEKGTQYASFDVSYNGNMYEMCFVARGKWFLKTAGGATVNQGLFKNAGKTLQIGSGKYKDTVIQGESVLANTLKMLSLCQAELVPRKTVANAAAERIKKVRGKSDLEKYIGENLITVIGIVIIFIGVVFGVKYSIDHNLINPLTRILLGYFLGIAILLVGFKLKKKYEYFSAVMVSGGMAIMYFDTFIAYSLYAIFPQLVAFGLMIFFTIFTVVAAISYNRQVIAHIGLVGSYAIPFLLSNGSGNVLALFTYMAIINTGILIIGFKKDWKPLYYAAFGVTWIIFISWYMGMYNTNEHFEIGMGFGLLFFVLFYITFLAYKLLKKEQFLQSDIVLIVLNSTVFYGLCMSMLDRHTIGMHYMGLFTLATACIHFIVSVILFKTKLADRKLFYLSSAMVLAFITIAIPVQLEGTWITLLWGVEALILFWIGRTKQIAIYEYLSYPIILIAIGGLLVDWSNFYEYNSSEITKYATLINITFLTSLIVCISLATIVYINLQERFSQAIKEKHPSLIKSVTTLLSVAVLTIVYFTFKLELDLYWNKLYYTTAILIDNEFSEGAYYVYNNEVFSFRSIWGINYSLVFCLALSFLNSLKIKSNSFGMTIMSLSVIAILVFLTAGIYEFNTLRNSYLHEGQDLYFKHGAMNVSLRYLSYALVVGLMFKLYATVKNELPQLKTSMDLFVHATILWILCVELMNITDLSGIYGQDKLGLSILAGLYAVLMVALGIARRKSHLRIAAMVIFGITLVKLFFYDLADLSTISKTIVFITLGVILLIISFMYNKYKHTFADEK